MRAFVVAILALALSGCTVTSGYHSPWDDPLDIALRAGSARDIEKQLASGRDVNATLDSRSYTPLTMAAAKGDVGLMQMLLRHGADVNREGDDIGGTPLLSAVQADRADSVRFLLAHGADINREGAFFGLPIANARSAQVAQILIDGGADLHARDRYGFEPINELLARKDCWDAAKLLISKGVKSYVSASIAKDRDLDRAKYLLDRGFDAGGVSTLCWAVEGGSTEMMKLLVSHGARVNDADKRGWTALDAAVWRNRPDMAKVLIEGGARQDGTGPIHLTPLHRAAADGNVAMAKVLLDTGADVNACDNNGWTPLFRACTNDQPAMVDFLLKHGGDASAKDRDGVSVIQWATRFKRLDLVRKLENFGGHS